MKFDILYRLQNPPFGTETSERNLMSAAATEIEQLRARDYELRSGLHVARGALLGIGTDYAKEVADHLAGVIDPSLRLVTTGNRE